MSSKGNRTKKLPSHIAIDSLKIRIPIDKVKVIDPTLIGSWYLVHSDTGEVDSGEYKNNSKTIKINGITTRFGIELQQTKEKETKEFLVILVNSKELKQDYFQGITADTIQDVYSSLISHNIVSFTYEDFMLHSYATDVDFKVDGKMSMEVYNNSLNECRNLSKPSKNKNKGYRYFNSADNKGIEWSDRRTTSYKSNPYLKVYHKELEMKSNSVDFSNTYLKDYDYDDGVRVETTVKNAAHFRSLGINSNRLQDILELPQIKLQEIINSAISKHLEPRIKPLRDDNKLKPFELIIYGSIMLVIQNGIDYETYKKNVLSVIINKTERNRKRKVLDNIYERFVKGTKEDKDSLEKGAFWRLLNW